MIKLDEIKKESWRIVEIYLNAREYFNYCYYLHMPATKLEAEYLRIDRDLKFIRHSLWRLSIIELAKLFSDRKSTDKFNLLHFLSKLKGDGVYKEFNINSLKIAEWESMIFTRQKLVTDIVTLRDKIYAHTDPDKDDFKSLEILFTEIEELFQIVENVLKEVYSIAFHATLDLRTPTFDRKGFDLVKILAEDHKRRIDEIRNYIKK